MRILNVLSNNGTNAHVVLKKISYLSYDLESYQNAQEKKEIDVCIITDGGGGWPVHCFMTKDEIDMVLKEVAEL